MCSTVLSAGSSSATETVQVCTSTAPTVQVHVGPSGHCTIPDLTNSLDKSGVTGDQSLSSTSKIQNILGQPMVD